MYIYIYIVFFSEYESPNPIVFSFSGSQKLILQTRPAEHVR